jgi:hypothetical protein
VYIYIYIHICVYIHICCHAIRHGSLFLARNVATREMKYVRLNGRAHAFKCSHQMGVYIQEPLLGGKQTTHVFRIMLLLFYVGVRSKRETKTLKTTGGVVSVPCVLSGLLYYHAG